MNNSYRKSKYGSYNSARYRSSYNKKKRYKNKRYRKQGPDKELLKKIALIIGAVVLVFGVVIAFSLLLKNCDCSDLGNNISKSQQTTSATNPENTQAGNTAETTAVQKPEFIEPKITDNGSNGKIDGEFYVWNKKIFKEFLGESVNAEAYAQVINNAKTKLGEDIKVHNMLIPSHIEMGLPERLKNSEKGIETNSQLEYIKSAYSKLNNGVNAINCYNQLAQHNNEYIYFNTDYRWTALGAYYGYNSFAEKNGLSPVSLDNLKKKKVSGFVGSYQAYYKDFGLGKENIEYWDYSDLYSVSINLTNYQGEVEPAYSCFYTGPADENDKFIVFLQGNYPLQDIKSNSKNAEKDKICIVHESFANPMISYFTYNYKEVYSINMDNWEGNLKEFCKKNKINEVLFVNDVSSSADNDTLNKLKDITK